MLELLTSSKTIGLEPTSSEVKGAEVSIRKEKPFIHRLFAFTGSVENPIDVKQLSMNRSLIITGLEGYDVLIRPLHLPLVKEKDMESALAFQAEPLLPYPAENAIFAYQTLHQDSEGTDITLLSVRKDLISKHLDYWHQIKIEPDVVSCIQMALCHFGEHYVLTNKPFLLLHLNEKFMTCLIVKEGQLLASYTHPEGLDLIRQAYEKDKVFADIPFQHIYFNSLPSDSFPNLTETVKQLQRAFIKLHYALSKEIKGEPLEGILLTGEVLLLPGLDQVLVEKLTIPLLTCIDSSDGLITQDKQRYAISIGLALEALSKAKKKAVNFRQQEFAHPYPWRRITIPLICYFILVTILTITSYFFGQHYLLHQEQELKQAYVDLLASMGKSYENFESTFLAKNPFAREKTNGEIINVSKLQQQDLLERLAFLQKDLQATPDSFPLFANIPLVSDVLAWLSQHPYVVRKDENGNLESRLQLENFTYTMLKRPNQGKKQEKYQVKVELEFSSPTPTWAREFHDALITPNDLVDPKGEVKWSSNRGKYRTSFYLKDKTSYPSQ